MKSTVSASSKGPVGHIKGKSHGWQRVWNVMGSKKGPSFHQTWGSHCGVEETGHLRCNPCWPIIVTGILKDSSASIFRVKQCNMSEVLKPEDVSTTILPNTGTYWRVNMASSTSLLFPYLLLMPWKLLNLVRVKGKAIPLQAWTGPEGSRRLKLPDFKTIGTWRQ